MGAKQKTLRARAQVAHNLKAVMDHTGITQMDIERKTGKEIRQSTVSRILAQKHAADLDTLETISQALGYTVWQLMVPHLDPANPPVIQNATPQERELYDRLRAAAEILQIPRSKGQ